MAETRKEADTRRQVKTGTVTSAKGDKTIRVQISHLAKHPIYGKYLRHLTKLAAHDAQNDAKVGDVVDIVPCRRISKTKNWRLLRIVRRGEEPFTAPVNEESQP
jgi:small subunit ribosomal protein S17